MPIPLSHAALCLAAVCAAIIPAPSLRAQAGPPNILLICTDDQAAWTLGYAGNADAYTPHIDRLAREGATFPNSFVTTPVCSPARASLFTGRYASETGIHDFIANPGHRLFNEKERRTGLDTTFTSFVRLLAEAGYHTGLVGKWHLGDWTQDPEEQRFHPTRHGFRYFMGLTGGGTTAGDPPLEDSSRVRIYKGLTDDILTDHAIRFMRARTGSPFLLCVMYRAPHSPWLPVSPEDEAVYASRHPAIPNPDYPDLDTARVSRMMKDYLSSVALIDRNIGRLLAALDISGECENTVVIFTSDNGNNMGRNGIWHKGNGIWVTKTLPAPTPNISAEYRPNLFDHSLRVPTIVRWPGVTKPGSVIPNTITNLDWFPTVLQMARLPEPDHLPLRGRSLLPLLEGRRPQNWDNDLFAEYSMHHYDRATLRGYRTPRWKLIRDFLNPERDELYDLKKDPEESKNLIASAGRKHRKTIQKLDSRIRKKMAEIGDTLLNNIPEH